MLGPSSIAHLKLGTEMYFVIILIRICLEW
uniref:Uncharacterized protein n=1 Tax=Arundo donax TaxID=35708 RepID=A0A0A9BU98_ARUDO